MNNIKVTTLSIVVFFLLLSSCDKASTTQQEETSNGLVARTDELVYNLNDGYVQVQFTIETTSDSTAWFFHCGERFITILNRLENDKWKDYNGWGWPCLDIYSQGIKPLTPDSIFTDFIQLTQAGNYRLSFLLNWDNNIYTWSDTLYSNEFSVQ
ncbi:MAG: hypothetical protein HQ562_04665 [Candidatus Marinimicrobia bacterium]|nr:hypothetical protein [Candidatus Neomarinimicrobiota bacterium]